MKLLVLDGNSIFNRAFYGIKLLSNKSGQYTNAIYGFLTMLNKINEEVNSDAVAIAFDMRAPTFRHKAYDGYKAKRKGMPDELASQFPILKNLLISLGYTLVECEGFEADDILGTLAKSCEHSGDQCIIATGDRDSLQLVSKNTTVRIASTKFGKPIVTLYDEDKIFEVYGVKPKQLIDIKAIQGDSSDNIPGVPGIGEKGASELIKKYKSLDYIYENIENLDIKEGMRKKLVEGKDSAYLSYMLGTINKEVPINIDLSNYIKKEINQNKAYNLMKELEFFSLIEKMGIKSEEINLENLDLNEEIFLCNNKIYNFSDNKNAKNILEDSNIVKKTYNVKELFLYCMKNNINVKNIDFDVMLAAYIIDPSSNDYSLKKLFKEYDATNISNLIEKMENVLRKNSQLKLLREIEIPLAKVLSDMETEGFYVDKKGIKNYGNILSAKILKLEDEIFEQVGYEFKINSPKQLGEALFVKLGLPSGKKNKSGYSTSASVLENIKYMHPVIELVLEYRALSKLKSTYCDGMLKVISDKDKRIHSKFNQTETRTGRISSTEPNLQNIPIKTEVGREMRKFFCAKEGCLLVDADYSQIELRLLACMSHDKNMINAFKENKDIHAITASEVFNIPINMVTPALRGRAKAVNFGIMYGIGAFSLSKDIGVTRREAQEYIDNYLNHYKDIAKYLDSIVYKAKENGYVETMFTRRRYLPELNSSNFHLRSFGERVARNMPIQGTSADIIKIAMIKIYNKLKENNLKSKLILQVHDELIIEAYEDEVQIVSQILKEEMENVINLDIPLIVDTSVGKTWFDTKQ